MKYVKSIDGFRALAVLLVIISHYSKQHWGISKLLVGRTGVTMFFTLSGFLITGILLRCRESVFYQKIKVGNALKVFYARRTVRIFPAYYLLLLLILLFYPAYYAQYPGSFYWCLAYASNIYIYITHTFIGDLGHTWSLAVEEQFYLFWPLIILFTPQKYLLKVICIFIAAAIFVRLGFAIFQPSNNSLEYYGILTVTCFDAFGIGALLALYKYEQTDFNAFGKWANRLAIVAFPLFVWSLVSANPIIVALSPLFVSVLSGALIFTLVSNKSHVITGIFSHPIPAYIGKISYGLYLWHLPIPMIYQDISNFLYAHGWLIPFTKYSLLPFAGGASQSFIYFAATILVASLSWFLYEKPINELKKKFDYQVSSDI